MIEAEQNRSIALFPCIVYNIDIFTSYTTGSSVFISKTYLLVHTLSVIIVMSMQENYINVCVPRFNEKCEFHYFIETRRWSCANMGNMYFMSANH